jgi:riboflavin kinase/FMN adenylyltransferase
LGFPTANIAIDERLDIENGVYSSRVFVEGESYVAMTNVGVRPSVDGSKRLLETHLFGFEGLLYGLTLRVELYDKIRDEKRFDSVDELRQQIEKDSNKIKELMANCQ